MKESVSGSVMAAKSENNGENMKKAKTKWRKYGGYRPRIEEGVIGAENEKAQ